MVWKHIPAFFALPEIPSSDPRLAAAARTAFESLESRQLLAVDLTAGQKYDTDMDYSQPTAVELHWTAPATEPENRC